MRKRIDSCEEEDTCTRPLTFENLFQGLMDSCPFRYFW